MPRGLSEGSVRIIRAVLHRSCRVARRWSGNTLPNPIADTELPTWRLDEKRERVRAPSSVEMDRDADREAVCDECIMRGIKVHSTERPRLELERLAHRTTPPDVQLCDY